MGMARDGSSGGAAQGPSPIRACGIFTRIALWLDARSLRSYPQDMHSWSAKMETLRALKTSAPRTAWRRAVALPACRMPEVASALQQGTISVSAAH